MLRIGICDDDEQFALLLEEMVLNYAKTKGLSIDTQTFMSSDKLFECIEEEGLFDILFLDIELGNETGVDIGMTIRSDLKNETMQIVYVSAKEEYAMQLFNIRPMNFLVKPINYQKVAYILDEYERLYDFQNRFFTYNIGKRKYRMNENCILYFQSQGKKIKMITQDGTIEFYGKLSDAIPHLNERMFCVVHKSFVINMRYVSQHRSDSILMLDGTEIPISQSMKQTVKDKILGDFMA
ncbi:MAG: response regulator transcription factor [Lachnospiraceae bacterium]|nr:response regulator transcription factor [Lachnospiraceae bacterium]